MKQESHSRVRSASSPARSVTSSTVWQKQVGQRPRGCRLVSPHFFAEDPLRLAVVGRWIILPRRKSRPRPILDVGLEPRYRDLFWVPKRNDVGPGHYR